MNKPNIEISTLAKNCNESLILAVLYEQERHGYEIALSIEEASGSAFKFNHGTLYPILHKLEKDRLIAGYWEESDSRRKRKFYGITEKGRAYFLAQKAGWKSFYKQFFNVIGEKDL